MKTSLIALSSIIVLGTAACSKKSEPTPTPPPQAPAPAAPAPASLTDSAKAAAAETQAAANAALAEAKAKLQDTAATVQTTTQAAVTETKAAAQAAKTETQAAATSATNQLQATAAGLQASLNSNPAPAAPKTESSLSSLAANLTPASLTSWYNNANKDTTALITSLGAKAAELGAQASPKFKSLYDQALVQKKNFDDIYGQVKAGGIAQWAELYPKLQTAWGDLNKTLTEAKALLQ